jgi:hypothetical protein
MGILMGFFKFSSESKISLMVKTIFQILHHYHICKEWDNCQNQKKRFEILELAILYDENKLH